MAVWLKESKLNKLLKIFLFLISPVLSLFYSLKNLKTKSSYLVLFAVALFFGMALTVPKGEFTGSSFDGSFYREQFEQYSMKSYLNYVDGLKEFLHFSPLRKDYYFDTVAFFISRFTSNYHAMFLAFAFVFAFFALKSFKFLTSENNFDASLSCFILAYLFMMNQIFNINGVRFWTAGWIGVYCIFQIFRNRNNMYFLLLCCIPFVHGSFWIFLAVILMAFLLKKFEKIWIILFVVSFFVSSIAVELITDASSLLPPFLQSLSHSYTSNEAIKKFNQSGTGFSWVARLFEFLARLYINFMVYLFIKNSDKIKANANTKSLYPFLLVYMTFANFTLPVPSLGGRYIALALPVIAYIWLVNFKGRHYKKLLYAMPFVFWFTIYTQIIGYLSVLQVDFYLSNPFYLIYKYLLT